jgi:hypothetical protein
MFGEVQRTVPGLGQCSPIDGGKLRGQNVDSVRALHADNDTHAHVRRDVERVAG